jgi:galactose-1-phosphate uridylyltransferase
MEFRKEVEVSKLVSGDKVMESVVEVRYDPLTLQTSRIVRKNISLSASESFEEEIESSKSWCPFCGERLDSMAVREAEIMNGELWRKGEAVMFSNLTPYSRYSLVIRISEAHYLPLSDFKTEHFLNSFYLVQDFLKRLPEGKYYISIGMNYLKPAGSSIMHPHLQVLISETSTDYFARLDWSALEFKEVNGRDFWQVLVEKEKEGERFVGRTEKTDWLAAFAPKGFYHFCGIPEEREFARMSEEQLTGLANGIVKILKYYAKKGQNSFNFAFFCADRLGDHFRTNFHIVARTPFGKYYWCDIFFPRMLHDESIVYSAPEEYAAELKEIWDNLE